MLYKIDFHHPTSIALWLRIFKSNVLSVLLYGSETWKVTKAICYSLDVFQTRWLRRIFKIYRPNTITNEEILAKACLRPVSVEIQQRRWRWLEHVLCMPSSSPPRSSSSGHRMEKDSAADQRKPGRAPSNERNKKNGHGPPWRRWHKIDPNGEHWLRLYVSPVWRGLSK